MNPTHISIKRYAPATLTVLLALVMTAGVLRVVFPTQAADTVCGDGVVEDPEACDDSNLRSGDGCSSACTTEACGNAVIDFSEQCDDGNKFAGDGCNKYCQIEFCGDSVVQENRGEQCDDGNGISGDGCTGSCRNESGTSHSAAPDPNGSSSSASTGTDGRPPTTPPTTPTLPPIIISQATQGLAFIQSPAGEDYKQYLTREEGLQLETILKKLSNGRRLTQTERVWAANLVAKLEEAKTAERTRYTDLLKQFIATPISTEVVEEKELKKTRLVDVQVPVAIDELKRAVDVIRRGQLKAQVTIDLSRMKRQGIDFAAKVPANYEKGLDATRPIEVFATLKGLKEAAESFATSNVPVSLETIRAQVNALRDALPVFEQEYGISPDELESYFSTIDTVSRSVTRQDTDRVVAAVNRLLAFLDREKIFSTAEIASLELSASHAAANASRLIKESGRSDIATTTDVAAFVDGLSAAAPAEAKPAFERGTEIAQRVELLKFLQGDVRTADLRAILRKDGRTDFDERYSELREQIGRVGTGDDSDTACDDTMQDALRCAGDYLSDLQTAVRSRSFFTRLIGSLQDYFGIGS